MKLRTFKGGVFPPDMKDLSNKCPTVRGFPQSKTVTIPVTMGGAPNTPLVKIGDSVVKGQKIAFGEKFMSVPVHASVSGKVKKIQSLPVTGGALAPCIVIESDGSDKTDYMEPLDPEKCDKDAIIARIRDAGIVGMGGASFPAHVKLSPPKDCVIDYVLVNSAECEPLLTCDERSLIETPEKVVDGLLIVLKLFPAAKGIFALENNKAYIKPILEDAIRAAGAEEKVSVVLLKTKYPQGAEKFIVSACLGREVPSGKLPANVGCIIVNDGTMCSVSDAFRLGKPLIERSLTISGGAVETPCNIRVPVGTLVSDLAGAAFKLKEGKVAKIISGGPMMGFAMADMNFPIVKGTSGIIFLTKEETYLVDESPCIGCGRCVSACPMRLSSVLMVRELKAGNLDKARRLGLMDCIECGCCAYVCPANVRLVQRFRLGKNLVRAQMAEARAKAASKRA